MADLQKLYESRGMEKAMRILAQASEYAKQHDTIEAYELQHALEIGHQEAMIVIDWLADTHAAKPKISTHWIRQGRRFVLNCPFPDLKGLMTCLGIGEQRAFLIMQELERRKIIKIKADFEFERVGRMSSFRDLVRQMEVIGKKYGGRCEPPLLVRLMFVDHATAIRLAQYGEEFLRLKWKGRTKELM